MLEYEDYEKWMNDKIKYSLIIEDTETPKILTIPSVRESSNSKPQYKFEENRYLELIEEYINSTYKQHYSGKYQAVDMIIDAEYGTGFNMGNIMKYAKRYGKKNGYNRDDLMKIVHYAILQMYVQDYELNKNKGEK